MPLLLIHEPYDRARAGVAVAAEHLAADRARLGTGVDALLDGGWSGAAADAFAAAWSDWQRGAARVERALATTAALLGEVHADLVDHDDDAARGLARLDGRLGR